MAHVYYDLIDLTPDEESDDMESPELAFEDPYGEAEDPFDDFLDNEEMRMAVNRRDAEDNVIDLTEIENLPDIDVPPSSQERPADDVPRFSIEQALQMILDILPDISITHALQQIQDKTSDDRRTLERCEQLIADLLEDGTYPKQADEEKSLKRKRSDSNEIDISEFETGDHTKGGVIYSTQATKLLQDEFLSIPVKHIQAILQDDRTLFKAYATLERQWQNHRQVASTSFNKNPRKSGNFVSKVIALSENDVSVQDARDGAKQLLRELAAAKKKCAEEQAKRRRAEDDKQAEDENLRLAQLNNEMSECGTCYDDYPTNRMVYCDGHMAHFFCRTCAKMYVETEMSQGKCRPTCQSMEGCQASFSRQHLREVLGDGSFGRLERLQQQEDIRAAGIEDLEGCPWCDYQAEYPPVAQNKVFQCLNPECNKASCRLCRNESHLPKSCEEFLKDNKLSVRHQLEEAMSDALIRQCQKCPNRFIKDYGCNKMTCPSCHTTQCYVCGKIVTNYDHFSDRNPTNSCPLHDNVEQRHDEEVKKAEAAARARLQAENSHVDDKDLEIQVSDRVKQEEGARRRRAQRNHEGFGFHMDGDQVVQGLPPLAHAPAAEPIARLPPMIPFQLARFNPYPPPVPFQLAQPDQPANVAHQPPLGVFGQALLNAHNGGAARHQAPPVAPRPARNEADARRQRGPVPYRAPGHLVIPNVPAFPAAQPYVYPYNPPPPYPQQLEETRRRANDEQQVAEWLRLRHPNPHHGEYQPGV